MAVFYTEENWRGPRAWEQCKRDLVAQGYLLDWTALIPPPIPDDQNVFKASHMQEWMVRANLLEAGRGNIGGTNGRGSLSQLLSHTNTMTTITNRDDAVSYLVWSDLRKAEFDIIREALTRPQVWIDCDYGEPYRVAVPNFIALRNVGQVLAQRARCHLLLNQPDEAVRDLTLMFASRRFLDNRPITLVAAMINVAITGLYLDVVNEGIQQNAWTDPELNTIQSQLAQIKLTPLVPEAFKMELAASSYSWANHREKFLELWFSVAEKRGWKKYFDGPNLLCRFAPQGWFDQNLVVYSSRMKRMIETSDPQGQFFQPGKLEGVIADLQEIDRRYFKPFIILSAMAIPNYSRASQTAARTQTKTDLALIVLALEKFRTTHNQYPAALDALVPQFIAKLPHDVINGQPLKYRRTDDGSFVLYSVGWNEKDDGGTVALNKDSKTVNWKEGDWVWKYPAK